MVKKKAKGQRTSSKKGEKWQKEDVQVHTGLPPQVEGQLRCFLRLSIQQIVWISPSPPEVTHVRVKWWGEDGDGALFRPLDVKKNDKSQCKTVARYPIRSGPKQFASYLSDMGSIILEVLNGPLLLPIGYAEVTQIGQLSPSRPINGFFPVFTDQDQKIAEIQVALVLESLMASYDSNGSVPTTDISFETQATQESMYPQRHQPVPHSQAPQKPVDDPFISPASYQNENGIPNGFTDYASDLRQKLNYSMNELPSNNLPPVKSGSTVAITTNGDVVTTDLSFLDQNSQSKKSKPKAESPSKPGKDRNLLSVLLERGNKLRDQMVISSIEDEQATIPKITNGPDVSMNGVDISGLSERRGSTGSLFREILKKDQEKEVDLSALDSRAVDLMFGGTGGFDYNMMMNGSPGSSISGDIDLISDPGDPIHSESILQELFYKNPTSETSELSGLSGDEVELKKSKSTKVNTSMASIEDPANQRPPSRRSSISSMNIPPGEELEEKENKPKKKAKTPKRKARLKTKRTGSKKRRRSRSSARSSASEYSDSERACTPRSEISQVSFDLPASDLDEPEYDEPSKRKKVDGLSVERLTLLGRVHVARVAIDALHLTGQELNTSSSSKRTFKFKTVGKPPKPSTKGKKSMTYFIEYQFPVVATSRDKYSPNALATEVMRVASKNVNNGLVQFNHRSVFPIMFDGNAIDNWWKSALVFKVYARSAGQKVPSLIGSCGIPMKSVLKSESLFVDRELEVRESTNKNSSFNSSMHKSDMDGLYGNLKVSIELASDSKDFSTHLARTKLAEMSGKTKIVPIPAPAPSKLRPPPAPSQNVIHTQPEPKHLTAQPYVQTSTAPQAVSNISGTQGAKQMPKEINYQPQYTDYEHVTLHTLLLVPEGRNISTQGIPSLVSVKRHPVFPPQPHALSPPGVKARDMSVRNTYLACRMFWCDDSVHSNVCWGTFDPLFNFSQVAPMLMSTALLERMRNNFMVIEVWDKKTSAENDQLIGIVKISLHQFYMSFRDKKIANTLLKSQFPVIAIDNYLPIVNPLNGSQFGQLQICLAMGSAEQVAALQRIKLDGVPANHLPDRPQHYLERNDIHQQDGSISQPHIGTESVVEHIFEVVIEGLRGLNAFENMIWGEADCFVQYHFPAQTNNQVQGGPVIKHAVPGMKSYRSATTLCIPDPTFNDVTRHRLILPLGTPVQRELLTACAGSGGGGLPYEVWCRYYHPNVRDQCVAKTNLPLAKLCAMVTMQKRGEPSVQTFSLPLTQVGSESEPKDPEAQSKMKESGMIDVTIHYKTNTLQTESNAALQKNMSDSQVCISVSVIRAAGLKAAAEAIARLDTGMQYPAEIGVNSYVKVKLSFLQKQDERITRTIARSFCPEFSHHMDFPCPLLWTEPDSDAMTLAEIIESGEITLEIWHQIPGLASDFDRQLQDAEKGIKGRQLGKTGDVLLGTVTLSLASLLVNRTGINGWFPVNSPPTGWNKDSSNSEETYSSNRGLERVVGGLELALKFAHHNDRERVIHTARGVGWSPMELNVEEEEVWESEDEGSGRYQNITVSVDQACFPVQNALITGQNSLDKSARCYVRYKFYDKGAIVSKIVQMSVNSEGYIIAQLNHNHGFNISVTSPFRWYLREEKLEIQLWVTYGSRKHHKNKPQHRDKLIGTIYIDQESLNDERRKQHRISGMYPMYKPGASSLGGAFIRAHITSKPKFGPIRQDESDDDFEELEKSMEEDPDYDPNDSFHQLSSPKKEKIKKSNLSVVQEVPPPTFSVAISIDRALHLPHIIDKSRTEESLPNTYVSYQTAESADPSYTTVYHNSDSPIWDHQHETKLSTEMLYEENKNLVFKVWHKPHGASKEPDKSADRVLGFVSVDLTPLSSGLQQICGWYNITDFNGQCKGQIMVNICPTESVVQYNNLVSDHGVQPTSLPPGVSASGIWFSDQPMSLPTSTAPFSSNLPHFNYHYDQVESHHVQLQQQLSENIRTFLQRHQDSLETPTSTLPSMPTLQTSLSTSAPALSQVPNTLSTQVDSGVGDSSRSFLYSSLRKQMQDLDDITNKLKQKLVTSSCPTTGSSLYSQPQYVTTNNTPHLSQSGASIPVTCQSQLLANSLTQSAGSVMSSLQFAQSQQDTVRHNEVELMLTGSQEAESSQTGADSGAFSATHSSEKYQEHDALDSHRSGGSDKLDTFRFGTTPRDFVGLTETTSTMACDSTPRDQSNNSDTGINMKFTPREDDFLSTSNTGFTSNATPRDPTVLGVTPRENFSPREITEHSDPSSLGFYYHGENSQRSTGSFNLDSARSSNGNGNGNYNGHAVTHDPKEMSIIQENTEYEGSDGEGDPNYYHRYRDILDEEENEDDDSDAERSEEDVIMPRTLNDISGKFGGIPSANDRSFHKNVSKNSSNSAIHSGDKVEADSFFDIESLPNSRTPQQTQMLREQFVEKDSWFSDNEDDVDKSSYRPSWTLKNDGTEKLNLDFDENNDDEDHLLEKVDLESVNSGSVTQREQMSRCSSAGSRRSAPSRSENLHENEIAQNSPRTLYSKVVDELDEYFHPEHGREDTQNKEDISLTSDKGHESDTEHYMQTGAINSRANGAINSFSDDEIRDVENESESRSVKKSCLKSDQKTDVMPNFFLPAQHLEASMKALEIATSGHTHTSREKDFDLSEDPDRAQEKTKEAFNMKQKLSQQHKAKFNGLPAKGRQLPTAEETKRIAKIFSSKIS